MKTLQLTPSEAIAEEIIKPMLDLFSGSDGGMAFVKLRHQVLPLLIKSHPDSPQLRTIEHFSAMCKVLLQKS